jgi:hypothetical protein
MKLATINEIPNLVFSVIDASHYVSGHMPGRMSANAENTETAENAENAENAEEDSVPRLQNTSHSFGAQAFSATNYFIIQRHYPQKL